MYGAEIQTRSAPHTEIKSEADDRALSEPKNASKTDAMDSCAHLTPGA